MKKIFKYSLVVLMMAIVAGCGKQASDSNKVKIVSSIGTYEDIAKNIVKDHGDVTAIIRSSNVDPHDFNSDTNTAKSVANADIVIANGLGYDDWMLKLKSDKSLINVSEDVAKLKDGQNEHVWFDVHYMKDLVKEITKEASSQDKKHAADFKKNETKYLAKLRNLENQEATLKKSLNGKKAYISEPVFSYLLKDVGVSVENAKFAKAIEDGIDPSVSDMKDMENGLQNHEVDFLVVNKQVKSNVVNKIKKVAQDNNVPIIYVTETLPAKTSYVEWINGYLKDLAEISK
ncbi:ABC transporter substrate-binding protein [Companilactobacillus sp. RD055328]|uniref:metal ABC transporter solute-binding protein, Zn/Mn family n=1 Tax=Companilactobacillus sp. RD055328 TaxID=2916634 RepID=UPI001FC810C2|nr:zinc ABC transporter substrate-binding protein [Companilactobacillus sp. RD055328]GKQ43472.1 ABC transporter substrate-binding protein [Companilactobacillus sp. RD055328]